MKPRRCDDGRLCFRLLSQLSDKEKEYQELLRATLQQKQEHIDSLRNGGVVQSNDLFYKPAVTVVNSRWTDARKKKGLCVFMICDDLDWNL